MPFLNRMPFLGGSDLWMRLSACDSWVRSHETHIVCAHSNGECPGPMQAYHFGFNHGLNVAEAVNWAMPQWLPFGCLSAARDACLFVPCQVPVDTVCVCACVFMCVFARKKW